MFLYYNLVKKMHRVNQSGDQLWLVRPQGFLPTPDWHQSQATHYTSWKIRDKIFVEDPSDWSNVGVPQGSALAPPFFIYRQFFIFFCFVMDGAACWQSGSHLRACSLWAHTCFLWALRLPPTLQKHRDSGGSEDGIIWINITMKKNAIS